MGRRPGEHPERDRPGSMSTLSCYLLMRTSSAGRRPGWRDVRRVGVRLQALGTVLALLTLMMVSGPHLVHHLLEHHPQPNHHHAHEGQAQQGPDCLILFSLQHTPAAEGCAAVLPPLLLVAAPLACPPPLRVCAVRTYVFQARAPPVLL
jgi:hypothetical protein